MAVDQDDQDQQFFRVSRRTWAKWGGNLEHVFSKSAKSSDHHKAMPVKARRRDKTFT